MEGISMELLTQEGGAFLARWAHFLAGITWIGILYYFNFVQVPAFGEMEPGPRSEALRKITFRALWWFRWGAALTILSGVTIIGFQENFTSDYFTSAAGTSIGTGILLGTIMFGNVWIVIWPAQKIAIGSAQTVADGGEADPGAAAAARRAGLASRANTLFSIPLLFFMAATTHLVGVRDFEVGSISGDSLALYWAIVVVLVGALELSALGRLFGYGPGWSKTPFDSIRGVIIAGFVLLILLYIVFEILFAGSA